jgi:hypothetical protein
MRLLTLDLWLQTNAFVVPGTWFGWSEDYLVEWLKRHYRELGFEGIVHESDALYDEMKGMMGFYGPPDFLVYDHGVWLRLEVESTPACLTTHPHGFCDILLCYRAGKTPKWFAGRTITLQEVMGFDCAVTEYEAASCTPFLGV